jgi:hypothetical protein
VIAMLAFSACQTATPPPPVSTKFDGNKTLILDASYTPTAQSNGIAAWADVPVGTPAILEVTGPLHFRCQGQFRAPDPTIMDRPDLPFLDVGDGGAALFAAPAGHYTAVLTIPSFQASIEEGFNAGISYADGTTGVYDLNIGCVPVADSVDQLQVLIAQHVMAVRTWVTRAEDSPIRTQLLPLANGAVLAVQSEQTATALKALMEIRQVVQPLSPENPYYAILRDTLASIALLSDSELGNRASGQALPEPGTAHSARRSVDSQA